MFAGCAPASDADPTVFAITAVVEVGEAPHGIRFSADGDTAYVALSGEGRIAVVDLTTNQVAAKWEAGTTPLDLIATAGGWLVSQFRDSVLIRLDTEGRLVPGGEIHVGAGPSLFTPDPVRGLAWITLEFADAVVEVDLETGSVTASQPTGDRPYPGDALRDGSHLYVPNLEDGTVSVIDLLNRELDATVGVCPGPPGGALTPDQVTFVVACGGSDEVVFINTASFEVAGRVSEGLGPRPFSVAVDATGRYALVNNSGGSTISVVDLAAAVVVQRIEVGEQPIVVRRHPDGRRVLVSTEVSGTLVILEPVARPESPSAGGSPRTDETGPGAAGGGPRTEVVVLGMIHGEHETSTLYGLGVVRALVPEIDPDYWLTETGHKGWFLRALGERDDVELLDAGPFLDAIERSAIERTAIGDHRQDLVP